METVKGFRDIEDCSKRIAIRNIIENIFQLYNFIPVETPILEYEEFVKGNNQNDEAVSDIFKLKDRGDRELALRYEFTFQLKRLALNKKLPYRRYQIGSVFRDEPIKENRWRQFTQCDVDIIGSTIKDEAEILKITSEILKKLGIKFVININNRKLLNEILEDLNISEENKAQVIREIDKMDKFSEKEIEENLKKFNAEKLLSIFKKPESYFKKYRSYEEILQLKKACSVFKVRINFVPFLARGLSYYNGSVFEIKTDSKEMKETITAGGSYLVNGIQSTGISFGLDRLEVLAKMPIKNKKTLIISLGQDKKSIELSDKLRNKNIPCTIMYNKASKALEYANSYQIPFVIFIGDEEVKKKKFKLKNMASGKEKMVGEKELLKILRINE
ncbi:MAG: ATP phosphoribosyltransferase regulatory subunit [Candidatus Nanoarchaeia archaeon]|nr:ATP phosphoribosyltransferase regulatory subunit [Candidatus Nanoarchaeia archaeon]